MYAHVLGGATAAAASSHFPPQQHMALATACAAHSTNPIARRPTGVSTSMCSAFLTSCCQAQSRPAACPPIAPSATSHACRLRRATMPLPALPPSMQPSPTPADSSSNNTNSTSDSRFTEEYVNRLLELKSMAHPSVWQQIRTTMSASEMSELEQLIADMQHVSGDWERLPVPEQPDSTTFSMPSTSRPAATTKRTTPRSQTAPTGTFRYSSGLPQPKASSNSRSVKPKQEQFPSDFASYLRLHVFVGASEEEVELCMDTMGRETVSHIAQLYKDLIAFQQTPVPTDQLTRKYEELSWRMEVLTQEVLLQIEQDEGEQEGGEQEGTSPRPTTQPPTTITAADTTTSTSSSQQQQQLERGQPTQPTEPNTRQQQQGSVGDGNAPGTSGRAWGARWSNGKHKQSTAAPPPPSLSSSSSSSSAAAAAVVPTTTSPSTDSRQAEQNAPEAVWQQADSQAVYSSLPTSSSGSSGSSGRVHHTSSSTSNGSGYVSSRGAGRPMLASQASAAGAGASSSIPWTQGGGGGGAEASAAPRHRHPTPSQPTSTASALSASFSGTAATTSTAGGSGRWLVRRPVDLTTSTTWAHANNAPASAGVATAQRVGVSTTNRQPSSQQGSRLAPRSSQRAVHRADLQGQGQQQLPQQLQSLTPVTPVTPTLDSGVSNGPSVSTSGHAAAGKVAKRGRPRKLLSDQLVVVSDATATPADVAVSASTSSPISSGQSLPINTHQDMSSHSTPQVTPQVTPQATQDGRRGRKAAGGRKSDSTAGVSQDLESHRVTDDLHD